MRDTAVRAVPIGYGARWITFSWKVTKANYSQALMCMAVMVCVSLLSVGVMWISKLGGLIYLFVPAAILPMTCGYYVAAKKFFMHEPVKFKDLFYAYCDRRLIVRLIPYMLTLVLSVLPTTLFLLSHTMSIHGPRLPKYQSFISYIVAVLTFFSVPQMIFENKSFFQTIVPNFMAFIKNIMPIILFFVLYIVLACVSVLLLVLPFIFVTVTLVIPLYYVAYTTIFESFELPGNTDNVGSTNDRDHVV